MNYPGSDKKFRIIATQQDFQLTEDPFEITIIDQYDRVRQHIGKEDCFWDADGNYYFTVENIRKGIYVAHFRVDYEDDDYYKQRRQFTDVQELYRVGYPCPCKTKGDTLSCKCEHVVQYEEVWTVSIDGDDYLCGSDGKYILTADGNRIAFKNPKRKQVEDMGKVILDTMTGEQFKQFVEGSNPNGNIDTLPEMLRAAQGISDDETIQQDVREQIADETEKQKGTTTDIDEIFND